MRCDVAIIGGGPAGSTVGTLLKKYRPDLDVAIFEREKFPREHVGESLLPTVAGVLDEMDVWDAVEAANFPIKLGAVYRWGKESLQDLYYFHFLHEPFTQTERPGRFERQRTITAFQVDRARYDELLLGHAKEVGCKVFEGAKVRKIDSQDDRIQQIEVAVDGGPTQIQARTYVDASGGESILRKHFQVGVESPTKLRNIAVWDYWTNAEWAETVGNGGTYVYVLSLGYGWLWFIPVGPSRTSVGLVTSAEFYKRSGLTTEQLYLKAISEEPLVSELTKNAVRENRLEATKDWSFVADRLSGENWYLAGDACGFADPILAAGLTLAQVGARRVAYSIVEEQRGELDPRWLKTQYDRAQRRNILNHIRFADYWYSANEHFTDLKLYCAEIAKGAGLSLDPDSAFQWLGTGGFTDELNGLPFSGTYTLTAIKAFTSRFGGKETSWKSYDNNVFEIDLQGAERDTVAAYDRGRIIKLDCLRRGAHVWPMNGIYRCVYNALSRETEIQLLAERFIAELRRAGMPVTQVMARICLEALEALVTEGWVTARYDPALPLLDVGRK